MRTDAALDSLQKESYYALRALLRDNPLCLARVQQLLRHERRSADELRRRNLDLLYGSLRAATRRIGFYKNIKIDFTPSEAEHALAEFPIVTKDDLLSQPDRFYPGGGREHPWTIVGRTSGTSGTPLGLIRSLDSVIWENAFLRRHWYWSGFRPGMRRATLRGDVVVPVEQEQPPFWFYNRYNTQLIFSSRHLRGELLNSIADKIADYAPYLLQAYPSTVYELAVHLRAKDRFLNVRYIYTGSEMLYPFQRELIEERLRGRVVDFYGLAERTVFAGECEHGALHVNTDYSWVEIVDDAGRPTEGPGYLVGTTFYNHSMPLIRYRVDDQTQWQRGACACGRSYPLVERVEGRIGDAIFGTDGRRVSSAALTLPLRLVHRIRRAQVAQIHRDEWEIRVVPMAGFGEEQKRQLIDNIHKYVDPAVRLRIAEVSDIPRTAAGKYKWIVNECPPEERRAESPETVQ
jgi:phenylacetate-CoA ligase